MLLKTRWNYYKSLLIASWGRVIMKRYNALCIKSHKTNLHWWYIQQKYWLYPVHYQSTTFSLSWMTCTFSQFSLYQVSLYTKLKMFEASITSVSQAFWIKVLIGSIFLSEILSFYFSKLKQVLWQVLQKNPRHCPIP